MNLADIRAVLYAALDGWHPGFTVHETPVDNPAVPCLMIDTPTSGVRADTFAGERAPVFPLIVLVQPNDPPSAYRLLDEILSTDTPTSIEKVIDGISDYSCTVVEYGQIDERRAVGVGYLGVQILVEVLT